MPIKENLKTLVGTVAVIYRTLMQAKSLKRSRFVLPIHFHILCLNDGNESWKENRPAPNPCFVSA
ncbi:MAG: hypothetical protein DMF73_11550, partial [Acidobacteria bacterium]